MRDLDLLRQFCVQGIAARGVLVSILCASVIGCYGNTGAPAVEGSSAELIQATMLSKEIVSSPLNTLDQKRAFVNDGSEALLVARKTLVRGCSGNKELFSGDPHARFRKLMRLFYYSSELARVDGLQDSAARDAMALIRLGRVIAMGGTLEHAELGYSCIWMGCGLLASLAEQVDEEHGRDWIAELREIDDSLESVVGLHAQKVANERNELGDEFQKINADRGIHDSQLVVRRRREQLCHADLRLCSTTLCIELYRRKAAALPRSLEVMLAEPLLGAPIDPFGQSAFQYRVVGDTYILYSIGPDTKDDHGRPVSRTELIQGLGGDYVLVVE